MTPLAEPQSAPDLQFFQRHGGLLVRRPPGQSPDHFDLELKELIRSAGLDPFVAIEPWTEHAGEGSLLTLQPPYRDLVHDHDTLRFGTHPPFAAAGGLRSLAREILLCWLVSPHRTEFPGLDELQSAVRIRANIVDAAAKAQVTFKTETAERPQQWWEYVEDTGFIIKPDAALIPALQAATQPETTGEQYSFSCYRASEYVILLGMALELADRNPDLLAALEHRWRQHPIQSKRFHEVFLEELGSADAPIPHNYYVPGDRVWFRNPDEVSSDVCGYEGSWTIYLGGGLFANFWERDRPFTLVDKCLEIFHWRDGVRLDTSGVPYLDEAVVAERVRATKACERSQDEVLRQMLRYRDPTGVYNGGGCIDSTREAPRRIHPATTNIDLG